MSETYFGFSLDDFCEEIFHEIERVQDGGSGHQVAIEATSALLAAQFLAARLVPFIEKKMQPSDADGYPKGDGDSE